MPNSSNTPERPRIEPKTAKGTLSAADSLSLHWPEYLMEAGEAGLYLFSACTVATLLWHPASPVQQSLPSDAVRRMLMGLAMGATMIAIVRSPWGKQSGAHFNPAVTITFYRLGKAALWDAVFYCAAQLLGAVAGVALASLVLQGAPAHKAVRYAATVPGIYGDTIALVAELAISFILMDVILFASDHETLAPYTHQFAAILAAIYIAFESPLSGMSTNPARTFGPALFASYWHALWIYFIGPPLGMLAAAEVFLLAREGNGPYCAKLHHHDDKRCIFRHSGPAPWSVVPTPSNAMREEMTTAERRGLIAAKDRVNAIALAPAEDFRRDSGVFGAGLRHPEAQNLIPAAMKRGLQTRDADLDLARMLGGLADPQS